MQARKPVPDGSEPATGSAFRANVSLALAIAVANTLLYGADHLSKGNVVLPPDDNSPDENSDEDALRCKRERRASALLCPVVACCLAAM